MKAIYKSLLAALAVLPLATGCIEEALPTSGIVQSQLEGSPKAVSALVNAMPGQFNTALSLSSRSDFNFGYPSMLHIRDVMTADMAVDYAGGYDWFGAWSQVEELDEDYAICQYSWNLYYKNILAINNAIGAVDRATENPDLKAYLAYGLTYRAFVYLDAARQYEFLPTEFNQGTTKQGNDILGLTIPIVTEKTTEAEFGNNPRVSHKDMVEFIKTDLSDAIALFTDGATARTAKNMPNLAVAYGVMARMFLWDGSYQKECNKDDAAAAASFAEAAKYARLAIDNSGAQPLTEAEWLNTTEGFNTASVSSWMFAGLLNKESIPGNLMNWTSFMCNEQNFGYAGSEAKAYVKISAAMYERMNDKDFRKLTFKAPEGSVLADRVPYLNKEWAAEAFGDEPYISVKFRPGGGEFDDYNIAAATDYPLMRVEEMYFIEAEAAAYADVAAGKKLLENFMKTYRYASYSTTAETLDEVVEEIVFQKRVELWGEGLAFFDIKRLNYSVTRWYDGTNFEAGLNTFNTTGRPSWMNFVIVRQEKDNNKAIKGWNNPPVGSDYTAIK